MMNHKIIFSDDLINKNKADLITVDSCVLPNNTLKAYVTNKGVYASRKFQSLQTKSKLKLHYSSRRLESQHDMSEQNQGELSETNKQPDTNKTNELQTKSDLALKKRGLYFYEPGILLLIPNYKVSKRAYDMDKPSEVKNQQTSESDSVNDASSVYKLAINSFEERFFGKTQTFHIEDKSRVIPLETTGHYDAQNVYTHPSPTLPQKTNSQEESWETEKQPTQAPDNETEKTVGNEIDSNLFEDFLEKTLVKSYEKSLVISDTANTSQSDSEPTTYELEKFERNDMIIFNHENFLSEQKRRGTALDVAALENTFKQFRFDVATHDDLTEKDLFIELRKFARRDFTVSGCVCVAILTHGQDHGYLRAFDIRYCERDVIACFDARLNPSLVGKPIIFLIQACRGRQPASVAEAQSRSSLQVQTVELDAVYPTEKRRRPMDSDIIMFHSSFFGRASIRVVEEGTWFIQTVCEQIKMHAATDHFEKLCRRVRTIVAHMEYEGAKQMPVVTTTLLKKLYFKKTLRKIR